MHFKSPSRLPSRQGITLLFTISMIVLFLLMGTAFVIIANDYYRSSVRRSQLRTFAKNPAGLLDSAAFDAIRGPSLRNASSPLRGLSIMEDLYGYGMRTSVDATAFLAGSNNALVVLTMNSSYTEIRTGGNINLLDDDYVDGILNGRVLSFVSGEATGYSTRVVSHAAVDTDADGVLDLHQIIIPRDNEGIDWTNVTLGDEVIINGREYSGFGAGPVAGGLLDPDAPAAARLTSAPASDFSVADASRPNRTGESYADLTNNTMGYLSSNRSPNEPHDAPDQHNMHLAGKIVNPVTGTEEIIPSFHRDRLYDYQFDQITGTPTASDIRRFSFRPVNVSGSNASTAQAPRTIGSLDIGSTGDSWFGNFDSTGELNGTVNNINSLDVDSDLDGVKDAVWIDIGLPDQYDSQGRRFRPLVAYRIIDMDGRLNLNAHGFRGDTANTDRLGGGYGVAEVSLVPALAGTGTNLNTIMNNRYGADNQPGAATNALTRDHFAVQKLFGYPRTGNTTEFRFATSADLFSSGARGYSPVGGADVMPEFINTAGVVTDDNPYLSDFSIGGGVGDSHYRATELEGLLRRNDIDADLINGRLDDLGVAIDKVTTHSFEIAIPAVPRSIAVLLRDELREEGFSSATTRRAAYNIFTSDFHTDPNSGQQFEMKYLSKDMLMGGRFNLNAFLGNGVDNNLDGRVDDINELAAGTENTRTPPGANITETQVGNPTFDLNNDPATSDVSAKALMAKQLYMLALTVCGDDPPTTPAYPGANLVEQTELYRKSVAQWAVNVVDFYDTDSTITVFEYDVNPFNDPTVTANLVDGNPFTDTGETDRRLVYGVERPEVLITETFVHHDRQSEDLASENDLTNDNSDSNGETLANGDSDWDSRRVPQSSAYIELYHPHRQSTTFGGNWRGSQTLPAELSANGPPANEDATLISTVRGVDLGILAPDASGNPATPVWRIAVHRGPDAATPDDHVRSIYFTDPEDSDVTETVDCFFPTTAPPTLLANPNVGEAGRNYLLLGSSGNIAGSSGTQTFGRLTSTLPGAQPTGAEIGDTRAIILDDTAGTVTIRDWDPANSDVRDVVTRNCNVSVVDNYRMGTAGTAETRSLSLSDPNGGYSVAPGNESPESDGMALLSPRDRPFDADPNGTYRDNDDMDAIWTNGIKQDGNYQFRVLKLQRLADPRAPWHESGNPYITVDVANVDLLAFNGLRNNPSNARTAAATGNESQGTVSNLATNPGETALTGIERGEQTADTLGVVEARKQLFRAGGGGTNGAMSRLGRITLSSDEGFISGDGHNFSYRFTLGNNLVDDNQRLETLGGRNNSYFVASGNTNPQQFSWLAWNNRPYANAMELANVPALSAEGLVRHFNRDNGNMAAMGTEIDADRAFSFFFGDDRYGHLMAFGNVQRGTGGGGAVPNRFDWIWEFIEVPNRFLGSETFLSTTGGTPFVAATGAMKFSLHPPFHTIPNFRYPGKINLNTIYEADVWEALVRGFEGNAAGEFTFADFLNDRDTAAEATDFAGRYTTAPAAEFVDSSDGQILKKGAEAGLFRPGAAADEKLTDSVNDTDAAGGTTDVEATAAFRNELRTRLGATATTRSNVYAMWVTIGYFEVDDFGKLGPEIGVADGQVQRNRAFYIIDRSIPVASEPGQDHNIEDALLVRTIIE